jgi:hypothetical protein
LGFGFDSEPATFVRLSSHSLVCVLFDSLRPRTIRKVARGRKVLKEAREARKAAGAARPRRRSPESD